MLKLFEYSIVSSQGLPKIHSDSYKVRTGRRVGKIERFKKSTVYFLIASTTKN